MSLSRDESLLLEGCKQGDEEAEVPGVRSHDELKIDLL